MYASPPSVPPKKSKPLNAALSNIENTEHGLGGPFITSKERSFAY